LVCYPRPIKPGPGFKSIKKLYFALAAATLILTGAPAGAQFSLGSTYEFLKAVRERDGNKTTQLLDSGGPGLVNLRGDNGETALTIVIGRQDLDWTEFMLYRGADPNLPGKAGDTPLMAAARVGFGEAVQVLLERGAKVDAPNKTGETALIGAVQQRQPEIVKALLNAGADPDKPDSSAGLSARDYAARDNRSRQILQLIEAKKPKPSASAAR
jgi:ankyrin repeat protein